MMMPIVADTSLSVVGHAGRAPQCLTTPHRKARFTWAPVLLRTLVSHSGSSGGSGLRIQVGSAGVDNGAVLGDLVDQRDTGRDVQAGDVVVGNVVQVLDQRTQGVTVSGDQDGLPLLSARKDFFPEVRDEASDDVLQALRLRDRVKVGVARVVGLRVLRRPRALAGGCRRNDAMP